MRDRQIIRFLISTIAIYVAGAILPGVDVSNIWTALVMAVILSLLNMFVRPVLVVLSLPVTILTLGLFLLVINGLMVYVAEWIIPGFELANFGYAILYSIVISIIQYLLERLFGLRPKAKPRDRNKDEWQ